MGPLTGAARVDIHQGQRQRHSTVQAVASAIREVVIDDGPNAEIAVEAALSAEEAKVCDMDIAGDEEGIGAGNESGGGGEDVEELHLV